MTTSTNQDTGRVPDQGRHQTITVTINSTAIELPDRQMTGREIKAAALEQGVAIGANFQLSVRHGNRYEVVGDDDTIRVHRNQEFLAVAPDDNS